MNVVSLDPGVTTGYATGIIDKETGVMRVLTGEDKWNHLQIWEFFTNAKPSFIISESFEFRHGIHKHHGANLYPREVIGIANLYCQMFGDCEIKMQPPMKSGGSYFSDTRLKTLGLFKSGKGHANDAARHLLYWSKFKGGSQFVKSYTSGVMG